MTAAPDARRDAPRPDPGGAQPHGERGEDRAGAAHDAGLGGGRDGGSDAAFAAAPAATPDAAPGPSPDSGPNSGPDPAPDRSDPAPQDHPDHSRASSQWIGQAARRTSLTRRIVGFNLIGLGLLVLGVLILNDFRGKLIAMRTDALETQGRIIAITIGEAARTGAVDLNHGTAMNVLTRLIEPTDVRGQIYDRFARAQGDTNAIEGGGVETLPPLEEEIAADDPTAAEMLLGWFDDGLRAMRASLYADAPPAYRLGAVSEDPQIYAALGGVVDRRERINEDGEAIVSVAIPITRLKAVLGVLVLSTKGGDIDAIVRSERMSILQVFLVALATSIVLSVLLANAIARPLRRLAAAAEAAERGGGRAERRGARRIEIPDLSQRRDEIGDLSGALSRMTAALYTRIEATEAFAADVAHEIKNPLTSLRSAVETMRLARTEDSRERLLAVIEHDVARLDRLVTDISNASRLDAELVREAREPFDLRALLSQLVEYNAARAAERGAALVADLPAAPMRMVGLEGQIAQVFVNLIENAVSFSPEGGRITVRLRRAEDGGALVSVEDDGPGIPDGNLRSIFERFYSERPDEESFGDHSGLGLSISRQIVEAHNGAIRAENRGPAGAPRRGARFVVELPA